MPHQLLTISHHIARITLHNPPTNVLNLSVLKELDRILNNVEEDEYRPSGNHNRYRTVFLRRSRYQ